MKPTEAQRVCIEETFSQPCAVVAGAGSGKTATLTNRIVYALMHPCESGIADIDEVLAITYTKKAAGELKSRIKAALQEASIADARMGEQALKVDGAWIGTIHSMCSRILKENALALGIDPDFSVVSDDLASRLLADALEETLSAADADGSLAGLFAEYPRDTVAGLVSQLAVKLAETDADPAEHFAAVPCRAAGPVLLDLFDDLQQLYALTAPLCGKPLIDAWNEKCAEALRYIGKGVDPLAPLTSEAERRLLDCTPEEALDAAGCIPKPDNRLKEIKKARIGTHSRDPKTEFADKIMQLRLAVAQPHRETLLSLAIRTHARFGELKRAIGGLDNDDLITLTARALKDPAHGGIAQRYAGRFKLVMVDEFQDTNQMQVDLINLVAGGESGRLSGRICVVGDAQQSIYRFRNADLAVFQDYVGRIHDAEQHGQPGRIVRMEDNFRSHGEILAFTKMAFEDTFGRGEDYLELLHGRNEDLVRNPFCGAQGTEDGDAEMPRRINLLATRGKADDARLCAARIIARDFRRLADAGHEPRQMAVLLGSMTKAGWYAEALRDEGLECVIAGGSVFSEAREVKLIVDLCYALVNPSDSARLASALASDLFQLEAADFMALAPVERGADGARRTKLPDIFVQLVGNPAREQEIRNAGFSARASNALSTLACAMEKVGCRPLSQLVEDVLVDSGWLLRCETDGQTQAANALKAIRILSDLEKEESIAGISLARAFDARIGSLKEPPGVLAAEGGNFVRIMTIHASKGLQFPIVAVAETSSNHGPASKLRMVLDGGRLHFALDAGTSAEALPRSSMAQDAPTIMAAGLFDDDADHAKAAQLLDSANPAESWAAIGACNRIGDAEELERKLYVAYTRAEEALLVVLDCPTKRGKSASTGSGAYIEQALTGGNGFSFSEGGVRSLQLQPVCTRYPDHPEKDLDWIARIETVDCSAEGFGDFLAGFASEARGAVADDPTQATVPVPTRLSCTDVAGYPYGMQWSRGTLSASSLKHADQDEDSAPRQTPHIVFLEEDENDDRPAAANDKGTAFHSLGEYAACHWQPGQAIQMPSTERIAAAARLAGLDGPQTEELRAELERWIASPTAKAMAGHAHLVPEAPFFIALDGTSTESLHLTGFIDLLAYDTHNAGTAFVVDYKTGRYLKTDEMRRRAYETQAKCYAYALLLQGYDRVELDFVFVDQPESGNGAPSVTHFPAPGEPPYTREGLLAELSNHAGELAWEG